MKVAYYLFGFLWILGTATVLGVAFLVSEDKPTVWQVLGTLGGCAVGSAAIVSAVVAWKKAHDPKQAVVLEAIQVNAKAIIELTSKIEQGLSVSVSELKAPLQALTPEALQKVHQRSQEWEAWDAARRQQREEQLETERSLARITKKIERQQEEARAQSREQSLGRGSSRLDSVMKASERRRANLLKNMELGSTVAQVLNSGRNLEEKIAARERILSQARTTEEERESAKKLREEAEDLLWTISQDEPYY